MAVEAEPLVVVFVRFLAIAVLIAWGASRFRIPYTIAMVIVGLGVSVLRIDLGIEGVELEPDLILLAFLPGLLFEASYHVDFTVFRTNLWPISLMAGIGVLVSTAIIGAILYLVLGLPLADSLLFGIIISATDPVAVISLFKQLGVGRRLSIVVEGESLFNDGIVIVGFGILVAMASGMPEFSLGDTLLEVALAIVGGIALGLIAGLVFAEMMRRTDDALLDIALTTILAYGTYLLAEDPLQGRVSPIIAVVVAGILVGNYGTRESTRLSARSTMLIASLWEFVVFIINSAIFLLIGLEVAPNVLVDGLLDIAVAVGAVLFARAVIVYGLRPLINLRPPHLPLAWSHVMFWGALRGAVSIALALSIPYAVESRSRLVVMMFGVVLFSMIVQGLTMGPLLRMLGLTERGNKWREFQEAIGKMAAAEASIEAVSAMEREHVVSRRFAQRLKRRFEKNVGEYSRQVSNLVAVDPSVADANVDLVRHELAHNQKEALLRLLRRGIVGDEVYSSLVSRVDDYLEQPEESDWELKAGLSSDLAELVAETPDEGEWEENPDGTLSLLSGEEPDKTRDGA